MITSKSKKESWFMVPMHGIKVVGLSRRENSRFPLGEESH